MHTEIVRDKPGSCPICGMALEPMGVPPGDEGPNPELVDFTRRFSRRSGGQKQSVSLGLQLDRSP
jgi:hypothetical protein